MVWGGGAVLSLYVSRLVRIGGGYLMNFRLSFSIIDSLIATTKVIGLYLYGILS